MRLGIYTILYLLSLTAMASSTFNECPIQNKRDSRQVLECINQLRDHLLTTIFHGECENCKNDLIKSSKIVELAKLHDESYQKVLLTHKGVKYQFHHNYLWFTRIITYKHGKPQKTRTFRPLGVRFEKIAGNPSPTLLKKNQRYFNIDGKNIKNHFDLLVYNIFDEYALHVDIERENEKAGGLSRYEMCDHYGFSDLQTIQAEYDTARLKPCFRYLWNMVWKRTISRAAERAKLYARAKDDRYPHYRALPFRRDLYRTYKTLLKTFNLSKKALSKRRRR